MYSRLKIVTFLYDMISRIFDTLKTKRKNWLFGPWYSDISDIDSSDVKVA